MTQDEKKQEARYITVNGVQYVRVDYIAEVIKGAIKESGWILPEVKK